ncbi:MAG: hypothetical protein ACOX17_07995 [Christensenellales bacterium]|jgi:hypothetical protein
MQKKRIYSLLAALLVLVLLSGCTYSSVLYGPWVIMKTTNLKNGLESDPPLAVTFDIRENGEVYMLGNLFGTYTRKGDTFTFEYTNYEGSVSGGWELSGSQLLIYLDDEPMMYTFERPKATS